jgi:FlaG/FlaF family flagellin (archaellin)
MTREALVATALCATAFISGCTSSPESNHEAPPMPVNTTTAPELTPIDLGTLPATLPPSVTREISSVMAMSFSYYKVIQKLGQGATEGEMVSGSEASGVRIAKDTYLSAGHFVRNDNNTPITGISYCGDVTVEGPSDVSTSLEGIGTGTKTRSMYGTDLYADRLTGSFVKDNIPVTPDISIVHAPDQEHSLPNQEYPALATASPKVGQDVYFVNYEPTAKGVFRSPSESDLQTLNNDDGVPSSKLEHPAIYGGVVTQIESDGDLDVADGFKSYGVIDDAESRPGASGGPVFNQDGQLVGLSDDASDETKPISAEDFVEPYESVTGISPNTPLDLTVVQPVDERLLTSLKQRLAATALCTRTAMNG